MQTPDMADAFTGAVIDHFAQTVDAYHTLIEQQRKAITALTYTVETLSKHGPRDFDDVCTPETAYGGDGKAAVSESVYQNVLRRLEEAQEDADRAYTALAKVSVMLGFDGDVDEKFFQYLCNRPGKTTGGNAYLLPDGSRTNVVTDALHAWMEVAPADVRDVAKRIDLERLTPGNGKTDDT